MEGLLRQGMPNLAARIAYRVLNPRRITGVTREFHPFTIEWVAGYNLHRVPPEGDYIEWPSTNFPESNQTWTHTSEMRAILFLNSRAYTDFKQSPWQKELERQALEMVPNLHLLSIEEARTIYSFSIPVYVNTEKGMQLEAEARKKLASPVVMYQL